MLTFNVPAEVEAQVHDFLINVANEATETFDARLAAFWDGLYAKENKFTPLFSEEIIFGQEQQITEKYKMSLDELKESLEKPDSAVLVNLEDGQVLCVNYMQLGDKRYLQILTPAMAVEIREQYQKMLQDLEVKATKELSPWEKICDAFASIFKRRGMAAAQRESYRKLYAEIQKNSELTEQYLHQMDSGEFTMRTSRQNQIKERLETQYLEKQGIDYAKKQQEEHEQFLNENKPKMEQLHNDAAKILQEMEEDQKKKAQEPPKPEQEPEQEQNLEQDPLEPEPEQLSQEQPNQEQEQPEPNDEKVDIEKFIREQKAKRIAEEALKMKQQQEEFEQKLKLQREKEEREASLQKQMKDQNAQIKEAKLEIKKLEDNLNLLIQEKKSFDDDLKLVTKGRNDKAMGLKKLDTTIPNTKKKIKQVEELIKKGQDKEKELLDSLKPAKLKLDEEKLVRDNMEAQYKKAQLEFTEQTKDWAKMTETANFMQMEPKAYLELTYRNERAAREEKFMEEQKIREENLRITQDSLENVEKHLKKLNADIKKNYGLFDKIPAKTKDEVANLEQSIKARNSDIKNLKKEINAAKSAFDEAEKKYEKEYLKPTDAKIKDTLDNILIPGLKAYEEQKKIYEERSDSLRLLGEAFQAQDTSYQKLLSDYTANERDVNSDLNIVRSSIKDHTNILNGHKEQLNKMEQSKIDFTAEIQKIDTILPESTKKSQQLADSITQAQNNLSQKRLNLTNLEQTYSKTRQQVNALY